MINIFKVFFIYLNTIFLKLRLCYIMRVSILMNADVGLNKFN